MFLISRCDAPTLLDPIEEPLDMISVAVKIRTEADWITPVPTRRDVRTSSTCTYERSYLGRVKSLIGENNTVAWQPFKQGARRQAVMLLTAGNRDVQWQAVGVDHRMDFGRQPSTGTSELFAIPMPDACRVLVSANNRAVDHLNLGVVPMRDGN